jgi:hyperosmotically inducible protein
MMRIVLITTAVLLSQCGIWAAEISTFRAYVDTNICAHLMLGPITPSRIQCSQSTGKDKAEPVLVQLSNNMVFTVNKQKMIQPLVSQFAEATGEVKVKAGTMKLQDVKAIEAAGIPAGDPDRKLLDASTKTNTNPETWEKIRKELAMMPYVTDFDFFSFSLSGVDVILTGWTVRDTNRSYAYGAVKQVPGVETVINNIEILPLGGLDMKIRAAVKGALLRYLSRYFWASGSDIKIIVKNGDVILLGKVATQADSDTALIQSNTVAGVYKVYNLLRVDSPVKKKS